MEQLDVVVPAETGACEVDPSKIEDMLAKVKSKLPKMDGQNMQ